MSYPPSLPPAAPYRPTNGQPTHVVRHTAQTQRHHPYRGSPGSHADPPDAAHDPTYARYDERAPPPGAYDQYNDGSPGYSAASLPARAPHVPPPPQEYPPSAGASPHTPQTHPVHPHPPPPPPHPGYHDVPQPAEYHPPPGSLYSASTYGNLNGQGLDPADLPNDLSALADAHPGQKPPYPYSTIIRYAIQGSPRQRLTLSELYETMEARFPWFKTAGSGWKNSVRHNLSLNRCFEKVPRPITEPGKGSYWTVNLNGPEGTRRVRKRRSKKAKAEAEGSSHDNNSQGPSVTDTASPDGGHTPSPPPQLPGANGSPSVPPPPGTNGYPPNWSESDARWAQQQQQQAYGLSYPPGPGAPGESYLPTANPAVFANRGAPGGAGYQQQPPAPAPRNAPPPGSWPHQPATAQPPPSWPRPRSDAPPAAQTYAPPPPPTNPQQRPLSAASNGSG
ncbi:hypothetical protein FRC08_015301 [Ceratobasidium sp. 394]|nr:hypothetical protein FRC08_015301 [Ceratobasidium sp. 394]